MDSYGKSRPLVEAISNERQELVVVGLTGRSGTGLGDIAKMLSAKKFEYSIARAVSGAPLSSEDRDLAIVQDYLKERWVRFVEVPVRAVLLSFLLDIDQGDRRNAVFRFNENDELAVCDIIDSIVTSRGCEIVSKAVDRLLEVDEILRDRCPEMGAPKDLRAFIRSGVEGVLGGGSGPDALRRKWAEARGRLEKREFDSYDTVVLCFGVLPLLVGMLEEVFESQGEGWFTLAFQRLGNDLRAYGRAFPCDESGFGMNLFRLPERTSDFCQVLRHYCQAMPECVPAVNPVFIVVNSLKNVFEANFFRQRYSSFYLLAVTVAPRAASDPGTLAAQSWGYGRAFAELAEDVGAFKNVYATYRSLLEDEGAEAAVELSRVPRGLDELQYEFCKEIRLNDHLRDRCYTHELAPFILQDVTACIEGADVFVTREGREIGVHRDQRLIRSIARFAALAMHPGLVKPTEVERCMQMAVAARLNSGCLSRQVGAVVTDARCNVLSLGWNDAPCGAESCARRSLSNLVRKRDRDAYSEFELNDGEFRSYIETVAGQWRADGVDRVARGLPDPYCFKDIYQDIIHARDQIHTRSLHAEERALATCDPIRARGGCLFVTSSPCELCAKRLKEAGIKKVYYIQRYPGISHDHVIESGPLAERAEYEFFSGAVGLAYMKLYTPIIPYKDEMEAMGASPKVLRARAVAAVTGVPSV